MSDSIGLAVDALRVRGWVDSCGERPTTLRMSVDSKMRFLSPCLVSMSLETMSLETMSMARPISRVVRI